MNPKEVSQSWEGFDRIFRKELQKTLNEQFPKVHEEGEEKRLMKRGEALVLYGQAVTLARKVLAEQARGIKEKCEEMKKEQLDKNDPDNYGACYAIGGFNDCLSKVADYITNTYLK